MLDIKMHSASPARLAPKITVIGVGGAGGNAVNNMISSGLEGCEFLVCNTDAQALEACLATSKMQLGVNVTGGLGAGSRPEVGRAAAEESLEDIAAHLDGAHMVFVTAGMGGGTGTGAAPVIAKACRDRGILTVGVVTKPFHFEGAHRMNLAEAGLEEMQGYVDTLIVIPNQNLFRVANEKTTFAEGFRMADGVLQSGVRGVTDLMVRPGLVNLDFADIRTAMQEMGKAMMGTGEAQGDKRAVQAAEAAVNNPLLDDVSMKGARGVIINVTGGYDMTLFEIDEACNRIRDEVDSNANIIFGATFDEGMEGNMRVSIVATGIDREGAASRGGGAASGTGTTSGGGGGGGGGGTRHPAPQQAQASPFGAPVRPVQAAPAAPPPRTTYQAPQRTAASADQGEGDGELFEQNVFSGARASAAPPPAVAAPPQAQHGVPQAQRTAAGLFIPPAPVSFERPASAPAVSTYQPPPRVAPAAAPQHSARPLVATEPVGRRGPTFLERLTGAVQGRAASAIAPPPPAAPPAQGSLEMRAPPAVRAPEAGGEADGLDIPAFLRRQAN
jgi:cell division protein FtsZ